MKEVHYLWGKDLYATGKMLRGMFTGAGHRSILRIGPAGRERLGHGLHQRGHLPPFRQARRRRGDGSKNLKGIVIHGDGSFPLDGSKEYPKLFQEVLREAHGHGHDEQVPRHRHADQHGGPERDEDAADPQPPADDATPASAASRARSSPSWRCCGTRPAPAARWAASTSGSCARRFRTENQYLYRQVSYDHEPIFAVGSMLAVENCFAVLCASSMWPRRWGSTSCRPAWPWPGPPRPRRRGSSRRRRRSSRSPSATARRTSRRSSISATGRTSSTGCSAQGTLKAAEHYGGKDYACVLGQEMAGYATGEVFFASQALGLRHSHLDSGGYSFDQKEKGKDPAKAVDFLVKDEQGRVLLTSMVACLFARGVYTDALLADCLRSVGYEALAGQPAGTVSKNIQQLRWKARLATGLPTGRGDHPEAVPRDHDREGDHGRSLSRGPHGAVCEGDPSPCGLKIP